MTPHEHAQMAAQALQAAIHHLDLAWRNNSGDARRRMYPNPETRMIIAGLVTYVEELDVLWSR